MVLFEVRPISESVPINPMVARLIVAPARTMTPLAARTGAPSKR